MAESVGISPEPKYLIVLHISRETGEFEEVYNGPGDLVWAPFANRKPPKNGQFQVSLSHLRGLNAHIVPDSRISVIGVL